MSGSVRKFLCIRLIVSNPKLTNPQSSGGNDPDEFIGDPETDDADGTLTLTAVPSVGQFVVSYGTHFHTFNIKTRDGSPIVIESLLPRPPGLDSQNEQVTLHNKGSAAVDVSAWLLRDASGNRWTLGTIGIIDPGASATVTRNGMAMSLNDSGDTITLYGADGLVKDTFEYTSSQQDTVIVTGH